jgi:hypothetical protein
MAPPIWFDPTSIAQSLARVENRLAGIEHAIGELMHLLRNRRKSPSVDENEQETALIRVFVHNNLLLAPIRAPDFLRYTHALCPEFHMLSLPEFRGILIEAAEANRRVITPVSESGRDVSLMADGVKAGGRLWQRFSLATMRRFLFCCIIQLSAQTSAVLAEVLAIVIRELTNRGFTRCGAVTANASNEKRTLDLTAANSLQQVTQTCLIQVPCLSHTLNLGLQDLLRECVSGCGPLADLRSIIDVRRNAKWGDEFHGMSLLSRRVVLCRRNRQSHRCTLSEDSTTVF